MATFGKQEGEWKFVRVERNEGISAKNGKPYDFATLTVADDIESFELDIKPTLVPHLIHIEKGDRILVTEEKSKSFGKTVSQVSAVKSLVSVK